MQTVYLYDPATGAYAGTYEAQNDPLEPGKIIAPTHSTRTPPPAVGANQFTVFGGDTWTIVDVPQEPPPVVETQADILARAITEVRTQRAPILNALAGIGFDAIDGNDADTQAAVAQARAALKEITSLPALLNAQTYDEMKAAVMTRYREIAFAAPETVQTAFREVFAS